MDKEFDENLKPDREKFGNDPFGYSALAWINWGLASTLYGFDVDVRKPPTKEDLKSPSIWMSHAYALSQAAATVLRSTPNLEVMPNSIWKTCDSQYCAIGLMLVGYSLEVSLKSMLIIKYGIESYIENEKKYKHHRLVELSEFIPDLSDKDLAILKNLTHFLTWAGRYPDPGSGREENAEEIFDLSEKYEITAKDLFELSGRVMNFAKVLTNK